MDKRGERAHAAKREEKDTTKKKNFNFGRRERDRRVAQILKNPTKRNDSPRKLQKVFWGKSLMPRHQQGEKREREKELLL